MAKPYTDHLYDSLPAGYRAGDEALFLYRMLSLFGDELAALEDRVDGVLEGDRQHVRRYVPRDVPPPHGDLVPWRDAAHGEDQGLSRGQGRNA
jgi:hypothetical protein